MEEDEVHSLSFSFGSQVLEGLPTAQPGGKRRMCIPDHCPGPEGHEAAYWSPGREW